MRQVRKVVFPVAGLGTRMLPATKVLPKEMLPVVDRPIIQYALEEAAAAGAEQFIFVTGRGKTIMEDHFDRAYELFDTLARKSKTRELEEVERAVPTAGEVVYTRQQEPKGLGHAVWCARHIVGDEPFAVMLVDDLIHAEKPCLAQMVEVQRETGGNLLAVMEVPHEHTSRYGVINPGMTDGRLTEVKGMVEKPKPEDAPSRLGVAGRYILTPGVFDEIRNQPKGAGGEIQLTDGIASLMKKEAVYGSKEGFLQASVELALAHPEVGAQFRAYLKTLEL
jgi:UTP--glucose-1-phosphate uridylyltransferase